MKYPKEKIQKNEPTFICVLGSLPITTRYKSKFVEQEKGEFVIAGSDRLSFIESVGKYENNA